MSVVSLYTIACLIIYSKIHSVYQLHKSIKSNTPEKYAIMFVSDIDSEADNVNFINSSYKLIISFIKEIFKFCNNINISDKILFDIDDSDRIIDFIKKANDNRSHLLIFINSFGGNVLDSDSICTALRTYQTYAQTNKTGLKITCVVNKTAKSAATILALSSDYLYMNNFAVLGPTDPQIITECNEIPYVISGQIYDELAKKDIEIITVNFNEYAMMKDQVSYYNDNINTFKRLKQYVLLPKCNKPKMINMFCENSYPHHKDFNIYDLKELGIKIYPLESIHETLLNKFTQYEKQRLYLI